MKNMKKNGKGILLCFLIASIAWNFVKYIKGLEVIGAPVIAIIVGMLITLVWKQKEDFSEGIRFTSKKILQYAVIFLGFGLNITTVGKVGLVSLPIIISTITTSLFIAYLMFKILKVPAKTATLIGVGSSVCGGSAIAATAPVIEASDEEIAQAISVIFLFNIIAAIIFPTLGTVFGFSNEEFGLFAGTAINDTSSVTAAASTWDTLYQTGGSVLAYATVVKLTRTLAIIPITLVLSVIRVRNAKKKDINTKDNVSIKGVFPMFIIYFMIASIITTVITSVFSGEAFEIAIKFFQLMKQVSKFLIVMAMGAIGLNTNLVKLIKNGGKPIVLGFACWIFISIVSVFLIIK